MTRVTDCDYCGEIALCTEESEGGKRCRGCATTSEFRQPAEALAVQGNTITTDYQHEYTVRVGCLIQLDNWGHAVPLEPCEWTPAQFRVTGDSGACSAINVTLTGRTVQRLNSFTHGVRCRIEFVQDGEPSIMHAGWMLVDY